MAKLQVRGLHATYDGEYDLVGYETFTTGEWHQIKVKTGLRLGEFEEAWELLDPDALAATVWVAMTRAGHPARPVWQLLDAANIFEKVAIEEDAEDAGEPDAGPPEEGEPQPADPDTGSEPDGSSDSTSNGSNGTSGLSATSPPPTGTPVSAIGPASARAGSTG